MSVDAIAADLSPMDEQQYIKNWLPRWGSRPEAKIRIYCLSYAGGGASIYYTWNNFFSTNVEICPVQLPGREERLNESPIKDFETLIAVLLPMVAKTIDRPYAIYGHSLGACLGYELARRLLVQYHLPPVCYFGGAHRSPCVPYYYSSVKFMSDEEMLKMVSRFNGLPPAFFESQEIIDLMVPLLRSDLLLCESYQHQPGSSLDSDMVIFWGKFDSNISHEKLSAWPKHSNRNVQMIALDGDHFFIKTHKLDVLEKIRTTLEEKLNTSL